MSGRMTQASCILLLELGIFSAMVLPEPVLCEEVFDIQISCNMVLTAESPQQTGFQHRTLEDGKKRGRRVHFECR